MKARPFRFSMRLVLLFAVLVGFTCVLGLATTAEAKVRPDVQLGDPTDTDPGPAPDPPKTTQKELARRFDLAPMYGEHRHFNALMRWVSLVWVGYRRL